jgi:hypothetical protein
VVSNAIYADPEVASYIKELAAAFRFSPFAVPIRGFDHDIFSLWRIQPRGSERSSQP